MLTPVFGLILGAVLLAEPVTRAPADRARDRRSRHLPRQPANAMTRILATIALRLAGLRRHLVGGLALVRAVEHGADAAGSSASCSPGR